MKDTAIYDATDEMGYHAVDDWCEVYDLCRAVAHLLGMNHRKLVYRYAEFDFRLVEVHGDV